MTKITKDQKHLTPSRCKCGALDYNICFCNISLGDFLATGQGRRP